MPEMIGLDVHLYLDAEGRLVITSRERPDLTPLECTRAVEFCAPLEDLVTARVEFLVGEVDIKVPLPQVRFTVADDEVTPEFVVEVRRAIAQRRQSATLADTATGMRTEG